MANPSPARAAWMITRATEPCNLEFPFSQLSGRLTPRGQHYVRTHFSPPHLDPHSWRLTLGGEVHQPAGFSLPDLRNLPAETLMVTMECAGNGRVFLNPRVPGVAWELGAVSTAEWTGVRLGTLLEQVGLRPGAVDVVLESAARGVMKEPIPSPGEISYARSVPLRVALDRVLLAYEMNGAPLTLNHGFPVRAVVPGWYGMASVKWLRAVHVLDQPFQGYFQTVDYAQWRSRDGLPPELVPLADMQVKAQIARPAPHERVPAHQPYEVVGAAWTGQGTVQRVELSVDAGRSWTDAEFLDGAQEYVWRRWRWVWPSPLPGETTLLARATDSQGHTQPDAHDPGCGTYMIHFPLPIPVTVCAPPDEVS